MVLTIAAETPLQDDVRELIDELNGAMSALSPDTPQEFHFRMTVEEMSGPATTLWLARLDGEAVGCGALLRHSEGCGEVKRMYVRPAARGQGIARKIVQAIEKRALDDGLRRLALETGSRFDAARQVYERAGFERCAAFGDYPDSPYSVFYRKDLTAAPAAAYTDHS